MREPPRIRAAAPVPGTLRGEHSSGLANFHGRPEDTDFDLSWIDREEAERRILEPPLPLHR